MDKEKRQLIVQLINLETKIGRLYNLFAESMPADTTFWKKLAHEEERHASLLKTHEDYFIDVPEFSNTLFASSIETIRKLNTHIDSLIANLDVVSINRKKALTIALQLETSAGEWHFEQTKKNAKGIPGEVFRNLATADDDHARRISLFLAQVK